MRAVVVRVISLLPLIFADQAAGRCPFDFDRDVQTSRTRRHLLQTNCALPFDGGQRTFAACHDLSASIGTSYDLLWSVTDAGNGSSVLSAAMNVQQNGWAGFGFPASATSGMLGGSAVIVKQDASSPTGASVNNYFLGGYDASLVRPPGHLDVLNATAAKSGSGQLQAVFALQLPQAAAALASAATPVMYAVGPLDASGDLQQHAVSQGVQDSITFTSGAGSPGFAANAPGAPASGRPSAAIAAPRQAPGPQPASSASQGNSASEVAQQQGVSIPAAGPSATGSNNSSASCGLQIGSQTQRFAKCQALTQDGSNVQLLWTLAPAKQGNGSVMTGALTCANGGGWCGWGVPSTPGRMVGASAIIVKTCNSCPTGANASDYFLASQQSSGVQSGTGKLLLSSLQAAKSGSTLAASFTMHMPQDISALNSGFPFIVAYGPVAASDTCQAHAPAAALAGTINLASGASSVTGTGLGNSLPVAHGVLMVIPIIILLPISAAIARAMRGTLGPRAWFQLHRALGVVASATIVAGFGLGLKMWVVLRSAIDGLLAAHMGIGIAVVALVILQALAVIARPKPGSRIRAGWNWYHRAEGYLALLLGCANAFIGYRVNDLGWGFYLGTALAWSAIVLAAAAKSLHDIWRARHAGAAAIKGRQGRDAVAAPEQKA